MSEKYEEENDIDDDFEGNFDDDDYGFIIGANGSLKSIMFPENLMEDPPREIKRILKIFGIKDIHELGNNTLH